MCVLNTKNNFHFRKGDDNIVEDESKVRLKEMSEKEL